MPLRPVSSCEGQGPSHTAHVLPFSQGLESVPLLGKSGHCTVLTCLPDSQLTALCVNPPLNPPQVPQTARAMCFLPQPD